MPRLLVTYYSRSGNTQTMAEAIADGAAEVSDVDVDLQPVDQVDVDQLPQYDGFIMGSPVYYGTMAAPLKALIDESIRHMGDLDGRVGGAFATCGVQGGGSETTVMDIIKALMIHGMIVKGSTQGAHYGPVSVGAPDEAEQDHCRDYGRAMAKLMNKLAG